MHGGAASLNQPATMGYGGAASNVGGASSVANRGRRGNEEVKDTQSVYSVQTGVS